MTPEERERYTRWQNLRVSQLFFSINLFLILSIVSLAYVINLLIGPARESEILKYVVILWACSAGAGCLATIFRLLDFRYTAQKLRNKTAINNFLAAHLGKFSWATFWTQIILYPLGAYIFIFNFVLA